MSVAWLVLGVVMVVCCLVLLSAGDGLAVAALVVALVALNEGVNA